MLCTVSLQDTARQGMVSLLRQQSVAAVAVGGYELRLRARSTHLVVGPKIMAYATGAFGLAVSAAVASTNAGP
jgi:hypothetical protein